MKAILRKKGFTLMEMLIVVAVIAILVAVAIPVFSAQLEKSREAVCTANRRSLLSVVYADAMTAGDKAGDVSNAALQAAYKKVFTDDAAAQKNYVCPSGGAYSWTDGKITCSKHDGTVLHVGGQSVSTLNPPTVVSGATITTTKGQLLEIGGEYYVAVSDYRNAPLSDVTNYGGVRKLGGTVYTSEDLLHSTPGVSTLGSLYRYGDTLYAVYGTMGSYTQAAALRPGDDGFAARWVQIGKIG